LYPFYGAGFIGVKTIGWALGVLFSAVPVIIGAVIILAPLPYIAIQVVQAVAVNRKRFNRRNRDKAIFAAVFFRKIALVNIGYPFAAGF